MISFSITLDHNFMWSLSWFQRHIHQSALVSQHGQQLNSAYQLGQLIQCLETTQICQGNPDEKFMCLVSECSRTKQVSYSIRVLLIASVVSTNSLSLGLGPMLLGKIMFSHSWFPGVEVIALVESFPSTTIRHIKCEVLLKAGVSVSRCSACQVHRKALHSQLNRLKKRDSELVTAPNSHANYRYLTSPEKAQRLKEMHNSYVRAKARLARLSAKLQACIVEKGVVVNST